MATQLELVKEAQRRGILPQNKRALYDEAVKRGLIESDEEGPAPAKPRTAEDMSLWERTGEAGGKALSDAGMGIIQLVSQGIEAISPGSADRVLAMTNKAIKQSDEDYKKKKLDEDTFSESVRFTTGVAPYLAGPGKVKSAWTAAKTGGLYGLISGLISPQHVDEGTSAERQLLDRGMNTAVSTGTGIVAGPIGYKVGKTVADVGGKSVDTAKRVAHRLLKINTPEKFAASSLGKRGLKEAGFGPDDVADLPEFATKYYKYAKQTNDPAAAASKAYLESRGYSPSLGQITRNESQLGAERAYLSGTRGEGARNIAEGARQQLQGQIAENKSKLLQKIGKTGNAIDDVNATVSHVRSSVDDLYTALKTTANERWDAVRAQAEPISVSTTPLNSLYDDVKKFADIKDPVNLKLERPGFYKALRELRATVGQKTEIKAADLIQFRKNINEFYKNASPKDKALLDKFRREFDDMVTSAAGMDSKLPVPAGAGAQGNSPITRFVNDWRGAVADSREIFRGFQDNPVLGKLIQKDTRGQYTMGDDAIRNFWKRRDISKNMAADLKDAESVLNNYGMGTVWDDLKQAYALDILERSMSTNNFSRAMQGQMSGDKLASNVRKILQDEREISAAMLGKEGRRELLRYSKDLSRLLNMKGVATGSRTPDVLLGALRKIPIIGESLLQAADERAALNAFRGTLPAATAGGAPGARAAGALAGNKPAQQEFINDVGLGR